MNMRAAVSTSIVLGALLAAVAWGPATTAGDAPLADAPRATAANQPRLDGAFQGGGPLLGQAPPIAPPPYKLRWTYRTDDTERAGVDGAPVIVGQIVYVADSRGTVHAIDLATGKPRWKYKAADGFSTTPLVIDGKVLLGDLSGIFHAISAADGSKLWTVDTEATIHSSANAEGHRIVFGNDAADLYCLDLVSGRTLWKQRAEDRINSAPAIAGGIAYFSGCDARLRGIDLVGGEARVEADLGALAPGSAVVAGDRIVVGTDQGRVVCLSTDGKTRHWVYEGIAGGAMVYATPAVSDGIVVVGARDRQVHAIDLATGKGLWIFRTRGDVDAPARISSGRVYVSGKDRRFYVLDLKTGKQLWDFAASRSMEGGVAIGGGAIVFGDSGGSVFCLEAQ